MKRLVHWACVLLTTTAFASAQHLQAVLGANGRIQMFSQQCQVLRSEQIIANGNAFGEWRDFLNPALPNLQMLEVMRTSDGRVHFFGFEASRGIVYQTASQPGWTEVGGLAYFDEPPPISVAENNAGNPEVFVRSTFDSSVRRAYEVATNVWLWADLDNPGLYAGDLVAAGRNSDGRMEVFATGRPSPLSPQKHVYHRWQLTPGGGWSNWQSLGRPRSAVSILVDVVQMTVANNQDGRLELFCIGEDDQPYHIYQNGSGGWSNWHGLGNAPPATLSHLRMQANHDGRLEAFALQGESVHHCWQVAPNAGWSLWQSLGNWCNCGSLPPAPPLFRPENMAVTRQADGRLLLLIRGNDEGTVQARQQVVPGGGWAPWSKLDVQFSVYYAAGCPGALGIPGIEVLTYPRANQNVRLEITDVPMGTPAFLALGVTPFTPPLDLNVLFGAPCLLFVDPLVWETLPAAAGATTRETSFRMPPVTYLPVFVQALVFDPTAPGGLVTSDARRLTARCF